MKNNDNSIDAIFNQVVSYTLKKYREKSGMSLEEVSRKLANPISRQSLFKYENNLARIKNNTFIDICNVLKLNPDEIFTEINNQVSIVSSLNCNNPNNNNIMILEDDRLDSIDFNKPSLLPENGEYEVQENNNSSDTEQLKQFRLLFDKVKDLPEESQKIVYNVTKSVMEQIDNQIDNKE